jgi:hypothetical protein
MPHHLVVAHRPGPVAVPLRPAMTPRAQIREPHASFPVSTRTLLRQQERLPSQGLAARTRGPAARHHRQGTLHSILQRHDPDTLGDVDRSDAQRDKHARMHGEPPVPYDRQPLHCENTPPPWASGKGGNHNDARGRRESSGWQNSPECGYQGGRACAGNALTSMNLGPHARKGREPHLCESSARAEPRWRYGPRRASCLRSG